MVEHKAEAMEDKVKHKAERIKDDGGVEDVGDKKRTNVCATSLRCSVFSKRWDGA